VPFSPGSDYSSTKAKSTPFSTCARVRTVEGMGALIIVLIILAIIFGVFGFVVKGLLWLAIIGIVLFLASVIWGIVRRGASRA
jgi:hypothetical protein